MGSVFAEAEQNCLSNWDKFWGIVTEIAADIEKVAKLVCKYDKYVMAGTAALGQAELLPFEEFAEEAACYYDESYTYGKGVYDEARDVIFAIEDATTCSELAYTLK